MAYRNKSPSFREKLGEFFDEFWIPIIALVVAFIICGGAVFASLNSPKTLMTFDYRGERICFKQKKNGDLYYYHSESGKKFDSKDDLRSFIDGVLVDEESETYDTETTD